MRKPISLVSNLLLASALVAVPATTVRAAGRPPYTGIWGIWGAETLSTRGRPWLRGTMVVRRWAHIEPENNRFDFSKLDDGLQKAVSNGYRYLMIKIYTGSVTPRWVYRDGVPKVTTTYKRKPDHPYYLDAEFKAYFKRMINRVADHIKGYPPKIRNRIIGVQGPIGNSGDPGPYYGKPLDPKYNISREEWRSYQKEMFTAYCDAYADTDPTIVPLLNVGFCWRMHDWLKVNLPRTWRKYSWAGHQCQHHQVLKSSRTYIPDATQYHDGWAILTRDECSNQRAGQWREAPVWNNYWTLVGALHWGVDFVNMFKHNLETSCPEHIAAFNWYNTYAGTHHPAESPGAWIALRDGLDSADTKRFPEVAYGKREDPAHPRGRWHVGSNKERYVNIAKALAAYGARQGDVSDMPAGACGSQHFKKMNDVAWQCLPGNYSMYLRQHDPRGTSQGWWRVGPKTQRFGRFARGFNHARGWDAMFFDLDDGFFRSRPTRGHKVNVRVVYFDQGAGKWQLRYDAVRNPRKTACTVTKTDSGQWKERVVALTDAYLGNRCPNRTDFMLVNADGEDDVFHMIEVTRPTYRTGPTLPAE